jgi:hypothetical protein
MLLQEEKGSDKNKYVEKSSYKGESMQKLLSYLKASLNKL